MIPGPTVIFTEKDSVVLFLKDLTEISKAQKFRTDFVANVSHELKTPLVSIKGAIETIEGPAKDDEIAKINFLKIISSQSKRMENLISDLLILSRIELQEHIRPDKPVNLKNVLTKVKDVHFTSLKEKNINLEINLGNVSDVIGDEDKFQVNPYLTKSKPDYFFQNLDEKDIIKKLIYYFNLSNEKWQKGSNFKKNSIHKRINKTNGMSGLAYLEY